MSWTNQKSCRHDQCKPERAKRQSLSSTVNDVTFLWLALSTLLMEAKAGQRPAIHIYCVLCSVFREHDG